MLFMTSIIPWTICNQRSCCCPVLFLTLIAVQPIPSSCRKPGSWPQKALESETFLHRGQIIKFSGDGALCSFESAGESVRAAMGIQSAMQEEPKIPLRIGIHQADVVFEAGDVHGDARLQQFWRL